MRRHGQGGHLPIPTLEDLKSAIAEEREMVACSALKHGPLAAVTLALDSGATATVCLDELGAHYLSEALKHLFPAVASTPPASPVKVAKTDDGFGIQVGYQSRD
jgi:hypothetical protein